MDSAAQPKPQPAGSDRRTLLAYVVPFAIFMLGLGLVSLVDLIPDEGAPLLLAEPAYWVYPLQSLACAVALVYFWKDYRFGSEKPLPLAILAGIGVFVIWIAPEAFLGFQDRFIGFDPTVFDESPLLYWATVIARFLRLVIIVPLIEEIFWRGFLQRYLIKEDFASVPFGQYSAASFWGVAVVFAAAHWGPDFIPALIAGAVYGWIAIKTKSLLACIVAHAVTNLALGIYIMTTGQWGYW